MNLKAIAQTEEFYQRLFHIRALQKDRSYEEALPLIEEALDSEALRDSADPSNARIHFLYAKAVCLDMTGRTEEALPIFIDLVKTYPGTPEFEGSIRVICAGLEERAKELLRTDSESPELRRIFERLNELSGVPYWLTHAIATLDILEGKHEKAWERMKELLALSPNDADYLRCGLSIAKSTHPQNEYPRLLAHVRSLLEERPYRLDLVGLLNGTEAP